MLQSFSSLLSSLGDKPQPPNTSSVHSRPQPDRKATGLANKYELTPNNAVAGVKRRSAEPETSPRSKILKTEQNGIPSRPLAVPGSRFTLSEKVITASRPAVPTSQHKPITASSSTNGLSRPAPKSGTASTTASTTTNGPAPPKRQGGFAAILQRAKAAEEAAKASSVGAIKHKVTEKLTKRERIRLREEALAEQQAWKKGKHGPSDRSRSGTPSGAGRPGGAKSKATVPESGYAGTMKKAPAAVPIGYAGTMKAAGSAPKPPPKKGQAQDKYGGYASWDDLDDAEDDEEEGYGSDASSDMEGGYDDVQQEESAALRAARKEDQEAMAEEEQLKNEKQARQKKLQALVKSAAAAKKRY